MADAQVSIVHLVLDTHWTVTIASCTHDQLTVVQNTYSNVILLKCYFLLALVLRSTLFHLSIRDNCGQIYTSMSEYKVELPSSCTCREAFLELLLYKRVISILLVFFCGFSNMHMTDILYFYILTCTFDTFYVYYNLIAPTALFVRNLESKKTLGYC